MARQTTPPTLEQRLAAASAMEEAALSTFLLAAEDLETAAAEAEAVRDAADAEAARLNALADDANRDSVTALERAAKIREFLA